MKSLIYLILLLTSTICWSQSVQEFDPANWNLTYNDEFNGVLNPEWDTLEFPDHWGSEYFSKDSKYLGFGIENNREYLSLNAFVESHGGQLKNFSAGIVFPQRIWDGPSYIDNPDNNFHFGYYEIESKLVYPESFGRRGRVGLWPSFWTNNQAKSYDPPPYWHEEIDIFEPDACSVYSNKNNIHLWTLENTSIPYNSTASSPDYNPDWNLPILTSSIYTNLQQWHKWGLMWLPDRITFYLDNQPYYTITFQVPSHNMPEVLIDLQLMELSNPCANPMVHADQYLGSFLVNYFRYYALPVCGSAIPELIGNNYNFVGYSNLLSNSKEYCIFKNTNTNSNNNIIIHSADVILKENFEVPVGYQFEVRPVPCLSE